MAYHIKEQLHALAEEDYRKFTSALIPNVTNILGVRLPELRNLAKPIAKGDWRDYLHHAESDYFEEIMLEGMVIGLIKAEPNELLRRIADFVPKIDNWSVCDSFCIGLKMTKNNKAAVWDFIQPYLASTKTYEIRFGVVMLLTYFIEEVYIHHLFELLDQTDRSSYYVQMAVAWAVSICYIKLPEQTQAYLEDNKLDDFTYNKALSKITESYRIDPETKNSIRSMKRKKRV
ncbi:DNA alkylation repair protein [Paenibacillus sinopodophylli]|uniref:DNA alkylation repair protein n=1 Tax=Paenibacillus sinopodophylli TaxID=1837342 RepID=UPI00110CAFCD|nr:DNA alkylation repair protein [Paenibacillus sinopodophylli]